MQCAGMTFLHYFLHRRARSCFNNIRCCYHKMNRSNICLKQWPLSRYFMSGCFCVCVSCFLTHGLSVNHTLVIKKRVIMGIYFLYVLNTHFLLYISEHWNVDHTESSFLCFPEFFQLKQQTIMLHDKVWYLPDSVVCCYLKKNILAFHILLCLMQVCIGNSCTKNQCAQVT